VIASLLAAPAWASWEKGSRALAEGDVDSAAVLFKRAAKKGDPRAQYSLAVLYLRGEGVDRDDKLAARWLRRAAKQGLAASQLLLGSLYSSGRGIERDDEKAVAWYRAAANQGDPKGQAALAIMLHAGRGVVRDDVAAYMWLMVSEANSGRSTQEQRELLATELLPEQVAEAERRAAEWKPRRRSTGSSGPSNIPNVGGGY